ncbi:MAG: dienelactone hydrolase family protein [Gallionella sp.]
MNTQSNLPPVTLQTGKQPQHSIIWLHGLGADGHDFVPVVDELKLPFPTRYIFPHAPMRPVTINNGFVMRAWYDITQPSITAGLLQGSDAHQDAVGIRNSQGIIESLITQEIALGIKPENIFLAGFSQGGAIALHTAIRLNFPLGGILALSTYLPLASKIENELNPITQATPIFMAHGRQDSVIPYEMGISSRDKLTASGYDIDWHEYEMQHSVCNAELNDIEGWLLNKTT